MKIAFPPAARMLQVLKPKCGRRAFAPLAIILVRPRRIRTPSFKSKCRHIGTSLVTIPDYFRVGDQPPKDLRLWFPRGAMFGVPYCK